MRDLAAALLRREAGHTLQPTAVVNEMWLRAAGSKQVFPDAGTFKAWATRVIRNILIDHARRKKAQKRGGGAAVLPFDRIQVAAEQEMDLIEFDDELRALEKLHPRAAEVVQMRCYGGMNDNEIANELKVSPRTVRNDWYTARAWLRGRLLSRESDDAGDV